ncbi:hypothetical protein GGR50DRAFT_483552 [Xylaria sp. CBS 124048]|nr:hypothetical protein GGR50DRAFT_483552 [Xylaria sp. CBS 124048]
MHCPPAVFAIFTAALFAALASTQPVQADEKDVILRADELWTLSNLSRRRSDDNRVCKWHMTLDRSSSIDDYASNADNGSIPCDFEVKAPKGVDCGNLVFGRRKCNNAKHPFYVSGAHIDDDEYFILTVENKHDDKRALFGYQDALLESGEVIAPQTSLVTHIESAMEPNSLNKPKTGKDPLSGEEQWTVVDMLRHVDSDAKTLDLRFRVRISDERTPLSCELHLEAPPDTDMATWTWYDKKLDKCGFYASWGYLAENDAGIMTLVSPRRGHEAWFGFDNINESESLGTAGPNPVYPCDCGKPQ